MCWVQYQCSTREVPRSKPCPSTGENLQGAVAVWHSWNAVEVCKMWPESLHRINHLDMCFPSREPAQVFALTLQKLFCMFNIAVTVATMFTIVISQNLCQKYFKWQFYKISFCFHEKTPGFTRDSCNGHSCEEKCSLTCSSPLSVHNRLSSRH